MNTHDIINYYKSSSLLATNAKNFGYEVAKIEHADQPIGYVGIKEETCVDLYIIFAELERRYSINSNLSQLFFHELFLYRTRQVIKYIFYLLLRHKTPRITFHQHFDIQLLQFLIQSPKPTWENDISEILDTPEISIEEYEERYYQRSLKSYDIYEGLSDEQVQTIIHSWIPTLGGETLLDFMTYLFPTGELKHKKYIAGENERMWFYIFSWMLWYKFKYKVAKVYEQIEEQDFSEIHELLQGKRVNSHVGKAFQEALEVKNKEYMEVLKTIQGYYQKQIAKRRSI